MVKSIFNNLSIGILLCLLSSCSGNIYIQKSTSHQYEANKIKRIVSIEPNFDAFNIRKADYTGIKKSNKKERNFNEVLIENAKKADIKLNVFDAESLKKEDVDYYSTLRPLKDQILLASFLQETSSLESKKNRSSMFSNWLKPRSRIFEEPPKIICDFNHLKKKYKTKYFAVQGVISISDRNKGAWLSMIFMPPTISHGNNRTYYYMIVVDVERAEIIYRDIRGIQERSSKNNLHALVYDGFKTLQKP